jgi:hypothetical protein
MTALATNAVRAAGGRAALSATWLAETALDIAPRIPVRDLATLEEHHPGLHGEALAGALIRAATRTSAGVGAAAGALASAEELAPPAWIALPAELVVETLAVVAIEMKLVAELHEVFRRPITGSASERAVAVGRAWAERRGISPAAARSARTQLVRLIRRRLMRRLRRNLLTFAPLLIGAVAGAWVNRRATRELGEAVAKDLAGR